ncbi:MAG: HAD family hydrolase [Leptothrix sp. (in: b-proteobacteria)]
MRLKHLIFDFGAVLFRWQPATLLARVLPQHAPDAERAQALAARFFGVNLSQASGGAWARHDRGTIDAAELVAALAAQTGLSPAEVSQVIDAIPAELAPMPTSVNLLRRLRDAGHRLFYLSNMPRPLAAHLEREHAFLRWFEAGVYSSHVRHCKPEAAIYQLALQRFGVAAGDCVFLDDHPANVDAARALGLGAVCFRDAAQAEAALARDHGIWLADSSDPGRSGESTPPTAPGLRGLQGL